jgi:hypothetical protein
VPDKYKRSLCKLRTANHKLPIERGRYSNLPRHTRFCDICDEQEIGDEYHFLFKCPTLCDLRRKFLPRYYYTRPNSLKFHSLMGTKNKKLLTRVAKYAHEAFHQCYWRHVTYCIEDILPTVLLKTYLIPTVSLIRLNSYLTLPSMVSHTHTFSFFFWCSLYNLFFCISCTLLHAVYSARE